jgi:glycosyltransferase involved in cell wall biosynthesis
MPDNDHSIHLINPLGTLGGSELRTLSLFSALKDHCNPVLWSVHDPHPSFLEAFPVKKIVPWKLRFPKTGTFVFVGINFEIGSWITFTRPRRVILVCNGQPKELFLERLNRLSLRGFPRVEVVYASDLLRQWFGYPGIVEPSLIDIEKFTSARASHPDTPRPRFTIGRITRDDKIKHHRADPALYLRLVSEGCHIRMMGATCLREALEGNESIELLPAGFQQPHIFLGSLDCFYYRTSVWWTEPYGRVVAEAMASGLPVVCENRGGYAELIDHGRNGFLFHTDQEAFEILLRLKEDRALCRSIGRAARAAIVKIYSPARRAEIIDYYLRPTSP